MEEEKGEFCKAWTKASLQRFSRGPEIMTTLSRFLDEKVEMENKLKALRQEFLSKWDKKVMNKIGNNLHRDGLKDVMEIILSAENKKADLHSHAVQQLQHPNGPISRIHGYIYGSGYMMNIINMKNLYNEAMDRQKKIEKDLKQNKKYYNFLMKKESKLRNEVPTLEKQDEMSSKVRKLQEELDELECNVSRAKQSYYITAKKEKDTRPNFASEMKQYSVESDKYETTRLETVKSVLERLLADEIAALNDRDCMKSLYSSALKTLNNFDVMADVEEHNKLFSFQYQFPHHDDDLKETKSELRNEAKRRKNTYRNISTSDEVYVLRLSVSDKTQLTGDTKEVSVPSRPLRVPSPETSGEDRAFEMDLPNFVLDSCTTQAPRRKTTTIDTGFDSDSSSDEDEPSAHEFDNLTFVKMKTKLYGIKTFIARTEEEISFRKGSKVYMTQLENTEGLAYGYVKKGKLVKKKVYGYFPAKLVSKDAKKKSPFKPPNPLKKFLTEDKDEFDSYKTVRNIAIS